MKSKVNNLKRRAKELGYEIKHSHALEILAAIEGFKDYNTYSAFLSQKEAQTQELYQLKNLKDLTTDIEKYDEKAVISLLHQGMGHKIIEVPTKDNFEISLLIDWTDESANVKRKVAVLTRVGVKTTFKHIQRLSKAMEKYNCTNGIIYTSENYLSKSLYNEANENSIEIVDHEDLIELAKRVKNN